MKKTIGVIFEDDDIKLLQKDAKTNGRLLSSHVRFIVLDYLNNLNKLQENQVDEEKQDR